MRTIIPKLKNSGNQISPLLEIKKKSSATEIHVQYRKIFFNLDNANIFFTNGGKICKTDPVNYYPFLWFEDKNHQGFLIVWTTTQRNYLSLSSFHLLIKNSITNCYSSLNDSHCMMSYLKTGKNHRKLPYKYFKKLNKEEKEIVISKTKAELIRHYICPLLEEL